MNRLKSLWRSPSDAPAPVRTEIEFVDPTNNFTPRAQQVLKLGREEAANLGHNFVGTEHLLLGLVALGQGTAVAVLAKMGIADPQILREHVTRHVGPGPGLQPGISPPYTPRVKKALTLAAKEARALKHSYVGTEHILLGLLREGNGVAARVLRDFGADVDATRQCVLRELDPNYAISQDQQRAPQPQEQKKPLNEIDTSKRYDVYCREGEQQLLYRNVLFKGVKRLFREDTFIEIEQEQGHIVFIPSFSITKFCEHGTNPSSELLQ